MKFDKLLHPEILLGKRGLPEFIEFYKKTAHQIKFVGVENGADTFDCVAACRDGESIKVKCIM